MEVLIGMVLLLQVLALIQLMLTRRLMLQQIGLQSEKIDAVLDKINLWENPEEEKQIQNVKSGTSIQKSAMVLNYEKEQSATVPQKQEQEALINEVLSEIFS